MAIMKFKNLDEDFLGRDRLPDVNIPQGTIYVFASIIYIVAQEAAVPKLCGVILHWFERAHLDGTLIELHFLLDVIDDTLGIYGDELLLRLWLKSEISLAQISYLLTIIDEDYYEVYPSVKALFSKLFMLDVELELEEEEKQTAVCYSNYEEG